MSYKNRTNVKVVSATGYAPYLFARSSRQDPSAMAAKNEWLREQTICQMDNYVRDCKRNLLRNEWECGADKKALYSKVRWEMGKVKGQMDDELESRRHRLSELLRNEDAMYSQELQQQEPARNRESQVEWMRARYAELQCQKEAERRQIVQEKREQQFRENCDELRSRMSQLVQEQTLAEGVQLMREKLANSDQNQAEEDLFKEQWVRDIQWKQLREDAEKQQRKEIDKEREKSIKEQIAVKERERLKSFREKQADADIMAELKRLSDLESEYSKEMKKRGQEKTKADLDECLRSKMKRAAQQVQEDLAQDIFFMQQIIQKEEEEKMKEKQKSLRKEQQGYIEHLRNRMAEEAAFEAQLEKMFAVELEKEWDKKQKQWDEEKLKRKQMQQDFIRQLEQQVVDNMRRSKKIKDVEREYAQKIVREDSKDKKLIAESLRQLRERNVRHQEDLLDQMRSKGELHRLHRERENKELEELRKSFAEEDAKIQKLLSELKINKEHPYRVIRRENYGNCTNQM